MNDLYRYGSQPILGPILGSQKRDQVNDQYRSGKSLLENWKRGSTEMESYSLRIKHGFDN